MMNNFSKIQQKGQKMFMECMDLKVQKGPEQTE